MLVSNNTIERRLLMALKKDMQDVTRALKGLVQKVERIQKQVAKLDAPKKAAKAKPKPKPKAKAVKKAPKKKTTAKKPETAIAAAYAIIGRSKKGVNTAALMEKTGFNKKKVSNLVFKLKQQGRIKSIGKGVYLKK